MATKALENGWIRAVAGLGAVAVGLSFPAGAVGQEPADPAVLGVVSSPTVERWLRQDGIPFVRRTGPGIGAAPIKDVKILVLPMESVGGPGGAKNVRDFVTGGGKLLAVYWGTVAVDEQVVSPAYHLAPVLGVRVVRWIAAPPQPLVLQGSGFGVYPYAGGALDVPRCPAVQVQPLPGTHVLARWSGEENGLDGAVFLRGSTLFIAADVLRPGRERPECRDVFFWALQRLARETGVAYQARDRIAQAAQYFIGLPAGSSTVAQADVTQAQELLAEARALLAAGRAARATLAADKCRARCLEIAERVRAAKAAP